MTEQYDTPNTKVAATKDFYIVDKKFQFYK